MAQHLNNIQSLQKLPKHGVVDNGTLLFNYMCVAEDMELPENDNYQEAERIARVQHKNSRNSNKHMKSTINATHCFVCPKCDWSCGGKTAKTMTMMVRLHKKKCKC
jgi:hypothetical protein